MPQIAQTIPSAEVAEADSEKKTANPQTGRSEYYASEHQLEKAHQPKGEHQRKRLESHPKPNSVISDLNQLSQSFVNSYQNLEGQVEQLNGQLENASAQRSEAIEEKQKLIDENQAITNRLQNLLAILPSGVIVLDGRGIVRDCNAVATNILGNPLLKESWLNVIGRAFMPQADDGHQISLKDGRKIHLETRALDSEPGQMIVLTDMTKTRALQAELSQQQKLSSMGVMVASLAHQIRTPLSAAILYGSHLTGSKLSREKRQTFSNCLMERLCFMERQISDMLNFVKGERKDKQFNNLEQFLAQVSSHQNSWNHCVEFKIDYQSIKNKYLFSDNDALIGALNNLINNAVEANEANEAIRSDRRVNVAFKILKENKLHIAVTDRGVGIKEAQIKKIFEPFYSTKSNGNGLGLAIVHGVVIEHRGQIEVNSDGQNGTTFHIYLPIFSNSKLSSDLGYDSDFKSGREAVSESSPI